MAKDQTSAAAKERSRTAAISSHRASSPTLAELELNAKADLEEIAVLEALTEEAEASNAVLEMIRAGRLDEAEPAAHQLLKDYPEIHDGYDHLGMIHEARGNKQLAASYYRKALAFIRSHSYDYNPDLEELFLKLIEELDPGSSPT